MKRKRRKSLPWRRFEKVILIIKKFGEFFLWISSIITDGLRRRENVSSNFQTCRSWLQKNLAGPCFFNSFLCVWKLDELVTYHFEDISLYRLKFFTFWSGCRSPFLGIVQLSFGSIYRLCPSFHILCNLQNNKTPLENGSMRCVPNDY